VYREGMPARPKLLKMRSLAPRHGFEPRIKDLL
jgi:hypothetical protein